MLPRSYLVVILQHLSDDPDLRVVVLYRDYSAKERTIAEAGPASPPETDGWSTGLPLSGTCGKKVHQRGLPERPRKTVFLSPFFLKV